MTEGKGYRIKWIAFVGAVLMSLSGFAVYFPRQIPIVLDLRYNLTCTSVFLPQAATTALKVENVVSPMMHFLNVTSTHGALPVFLLDVQLLRCASDSAFCSYLTNSSAFNEAYFGAFRDTLPCIKQYYHLMRNGWSYFQIGDDYVEYAKDNFTVGIYTIELRDNYWFIPASTRHPSRAVLPSNLTIIDFNGASVIIPLEPKSFLWQLERSQFLDCNKTVAQHFRSANPNISDAKPIISDEQFLELVYLRDFLYRWQMEPLLFGGTLLGWFRECSIITYTTDLDIAVRATTYSKAFENALIHDERLQMYWILGKPDDSLEMSVYGKNVKIDIFFLYEEVDKSWVGGMIVYKKAKLRWTYPTLRGGICSAELKSHLFMVPCNVVEFLTADYGPHWSEPVDPNKFIWHESHHNIADAGRWTLTDWPHVYRTRFPGHAKHSK